MDACQKKGSNETERTALKVAGEEVERAACSLTTLEAQTESLPVPDAPGQARSGDGEEGPSEADFQLWALTRAVSPLSRALFSQRAACQHRESRLCYQIPKPITI